MKKLWNSYCYAIILVFLSITGSLILSFQLEDQEDDQYMMVTVNENDSLWGIAEQFAEEHHFSTAEFVQWMETHNGITNGKIHPGDTVSIPVKADEDQYITELASRE
ncbi:cell division suppressor protein YneA [Bacillus mesophilum]|uniref:LysM peptidoglycan-binding domain-containing protein n=1 Tax=Bacillus mesophilum TaxID=1071718 RepID=A0A7V7UX82_9BACI|nr:LysM peptidoglycan-binding domain-containing protein [Bacillus mesophilum]KAB2335530.1 LysM peptidoglycan-binding domain-containing protein [Bacillus mesophilum]